MVYAGTAENAGDNEGRRKVKAISMMTEETEVVAGAFGPGVGDFRVGHLEASAKVLVHLA